MSLTIWSNAKFNENAMRLLVEGTRAHKLVFTTQTSANVLDAGKPDPALRTADIAFGQPDVNDCLANAKLRWVEVTTAGYTRYDTPEFRDGFRAHGSFFTNASDVFAEPCAQHALAMILAVSRHLLPSYRDQLTDHSWHYFERRRASRLLGGQTVLLLGYGAIGRRLTELLAPFGMTVYAVRRQTRSEPGVRIIPEEELTRVLPLADHVVNILALNASTQSYVNARRLGWFKKGANFYNIGRGNTVDEKALIEALHSGQVGTAYLDVFETEPLPTDHPFWTTPNCYLTPHTAGGRSDQDEAIVKHFLKNLEAFQKNAPLTDRIV
jgi:phosphoglycerate dehydrogenase-like enzyme